MIAGRVCRATYSSRTAMQQTCVAFHYRSLTGGVGPAVSGPYRGSKVAVQAAAQVAAKVDDEMKGHYGPLTQTSKVQVVSGEKPGQNDDLRFQQDWSVAMWRDFRLPPQLRDDELSTTEKAQAAARILQEASQKAGVFNSPQSLAYWTYHLGRMGFFASQGILGAAYSNLMQQSRKGLMGNSMGDAGNTLDITRLLRSGLAFPISEALVTFYQDYENIRNGVYKLPWDMTTPLHKQTNPLFILGKFARWMTEANKAMGRRSQNKPDNVWIESGMYPEYYLKTWHYQTDGWLSDESAKVYENSTETVFIGRQDAMQRQCLVPLKDFMAARGSAAGAGLKMLDVACGTGRVGTFIKDNYPKLALTQLDLSPFYLQEARRNLDYWRSRRGSSTPEETVASQDRFLHAPAEQVPAGNESFDVVVSTYLFHELPEESRLKAVKEMARLTKPGGMVIFTDGIQLGDRPINDQNAGNFQAFNEPNWGTHIATDYGALFEEAGLVAHKKVMASGTKVLSFWKPARS